jgi:patatin-like phospholipase/acyl hydrolase
MNRGGVRGIAQLEMLRAIEVQLGGDLPIQAFFDLIVGTG